jgi:hypothetical protein
MFAVLPSMLAFLIVFGSSPSLLAREEPGPEPEPSTPVREPGRIPRPGPPPLPAPLFPYLDLVEGGGDSTAQSAPDCQELRSGPPATAPAPRR